MRPLRLTMTAFGPFAGTEIVDFRAAMDSGLFGIYGPTGSGKSSIFNAMTFALFGEAAKPGQEAKSLRSDHAEAGTMTEVEFIFDLGVKRYVVRRLPEQSRPKARGEGETKQSHEAFLFEATGIGLEEITGNQCGTVLAEKKVRDVDAAVQELLGYGATQFRQIILLPQGDFEKFLTSGTDDRLGILRQLFDVSSYRQLADWFKEEAADAKREVQEARTKYIGRLEGEGYESRDALDVGIDEACEILIERGRVEDNAAEIAKKAAALLTEAKSLEAAFEASMKAIENLDGLMVRQEEIALLRVSVEGAKKAASLLDVEAQARSADEGVSGAEIYLEEKSRLAAESANAETEAARAFTDEQARSGEIDTLKQLGADLARHGETLEKAAGQKETLAEAEVTLTGAQGALTDAQAIRDRLVLEHDAAGKNLEASREANMQRAGLEAERATVQAELSVAGQYETEQAQLTQAKEALAARAREEVAARKEKHQAEEALNEAESALSHVQALHLAEKLAEGQPCPVCGSDSHPAPATGAPEGIGLTDAFRRAQKEAESAVARWTEIGNKLAAAQELRDDRAGRFAELSAPVRTAAECGETLAGLEAKLSGFGDAPNIAVMEEAVKSLKSRVKDAEELVKTREGQVIDAVKAQALADQALRDALETVPETLRKPMALDEAIKKNTADLTDREEALRMAEDSARVAREAALAAQKDEEAAHTALSKAKDEQERARETFKQRLSQSGLKREEFAKHKTGIDRIQGDEEELRVFEDNLAIAKSTAADTAKVIKGVERPDLEKLGEADETAKSVLQEAAEFKGQAKQRVDQLEKLAREIADEVARVDELDAQTGPLRELAAQFNGDNALRLTLEAFAIQAMFDQVLEAANLRLGPMSGGRYRLEREQEVGGGRAKRGLGIQVNDVHTGTARATASLSGGETFIAALALALGLSDVVESNAGSIRLDTIFIDEGFGSLDADDGSGTLDQVLQTLTNTTGRSRAVGLISHVALVKEAIPNGFQIDKTPRGSHVLDRGLV